MAFTPLRHVAPGDLITSRTFNDFIDALASLQAQLDGLGGGGVPGPVITSVAPDDQALRAGTQITISGRRFTVPAAVTRVRLEAATDVESADSWPVASFTVSSDTQMVATIPSGLPHLPRPMLLMVQSSAGSARHPVILLPSQDRIGLEVIAGPKPIAGGSYAFRLTLDAADLDGPDDFTLSATFSDPVGASAAAWDETVLDVTDFAQGRLTQPTTVHVTPGKASLVDVTLRSVPAGAKSVWMSVLATSAARPETSNVSVPLPIEVDTPGAVIVRDVTDSDVGPLHPGDSRGFVLELDARRLGAPETFSLGASFTDASDAPASGWSAVFDSVSEGSVLLAPHMTARLRLTVHAPAGATSVLMVVTAEASGDHGSSGSLSIAVPIEGSPVPRLGLTLAADHAGDVRNATFGPGSQAAVAGFGGAGLEVRFGQTATVSLVARFGLTGDYDFAVEIAEKDVPWVLSRRPGRRTITELAAASVEFDLELQATAATTFKIWRHVRVVATLVGSPGGIRDDERYELIFPIGGFDDESSLQLPAADEGG